MSQSSDHDAAPRANGLSAPGLDRLDELLEVRRALEANGAKSDGQCKPPQSFGRFRLRGVLGKGKFGIVFLADDPQANRAVALKLPQLAVLMDPSLAERFRRDVEAAGHLDHPGIVPVLETGAISGVAYIAMPYVEGPTLAALLRQSPGGLPVEGAVALLLGLADAVQHAHERGVLHCDLKPANVLLASTAARARSVSDGSGSATEPVAHAPGSELVPKIIDFGLARLLYQAPDETQTHLTAGTPPYMAPEQARGVRRDLTARCDVHALAAILYELLTGRPPYAEDSFDCLQQLLDADARPTTPRSQRPDIPRDLEAIVLMGLEKDPANRYHSARSLGEDLRRFQAGLPTRARPVGLVGVAARWVRRKPAGAALLAVSALAVVAASWMGLHLSQETFRHRQEIEFATRTADVSEFTALLERVRQRRMGRPEGWADDNLKDVRKLAAMGPAADFQEPLRTEAAQALAMPRLRLVRELAPGKIAYVAAFSPDGQTLALGEHYPVIDGQLRVWLVRLTGEITGELRYPLDRAWELRHGSKRSDGSRSITFSPDGRWLVVGTRGGRVVRWDLLEKEPAAVARDAHAGDGADQTGDEVRSLLFSDDGAVMLSGSLGRMVRRWDVRDAWKDVGRYPGLLASWTPRGRESTTLHHKGEVEELSLLDLRTGRRTRHRGRFLPEGSFIRSYCLSRDGGRLAAEIFPNPLNLGLASTVIAGHRKVLQSRWLANWGDVKAMAFSPDGSSLWCSSQTRARLELLDVTSGEHVGSTTLRGGSAGLAVSPTARHAAVCDEGRTLLLELVPSPVRRSLCQESEVTSFSLAADGCRLAVHAMGAHTEDRRHMYLSLHRGAPNGWVEERRLRIPCASITNGEFVALAPPGSQAGGAIHADRDGKPALGLFDNRWLATGRLTALSFAPDGHVWAATKEGKLIRWSGVGSPQTVFSVSAQEDLDGIHFHVLQPANDGMLAGRFDGKVIWVDNRGRSRGPWAVFHDQDVTALAVNADGSEALVGGRRGAVARLDLRGGKVTHTPKPPHTDAVVGVAYLAGGVTLTASADHTVRLCDREGQPLLALREAGPIVRAELTPGGSELHLQVQGEWGLRVWDLAELGDCLRELGLEPGFHVARAVGPPTGPLPALVAEFFTGKEHLPDQFLERRRDAQVNFNRGEGPPSPWVAPDHLSIRWTGWLRPPKPGDWEFTIDRNDGAKLWLDGRVILDHPKGVLDSQQHAKVVSLPAKPVSFRLDYHEITGQAHCQLMWRPAGSMDPFLPVPPEAFLPH